MSNDLVLRSKDLLREGHFSDLTITCGDQEWKVHKYNLWCQSEYFRKLLDKNFKEANATTLDLSNDDPNVLGALIHYFYNFTLRGPQICTEDTSTGPYYVHVYAIADKYDVPKLRALAEQVLRKSYAVHDQVTPIKDHNDLIDTIAAINDHTPDPVESGGGLWAVVLPAIKADISALLKNEAFKELLLDLPGLNFRLLGMLNSSARKPFEEVDDDEDEDDEPHPYNEYSTYGRGRRLGE